jgi:hypothetical protein
MSNDNKNTVRELARWLRIGTLTLTTLGPAIDVLITRLRERNGKTSPETESAAAASADWPERLLVVGGALSDLVAELKHNPYAQDLRKRGEEIAEELVERGGKLSQTVVERGSEWSHDLAERGEQATRTLSRRSQQVRQELVERSNPRILVAGFSVGLAAAVVAMYLFMRKRLPQIGVDEEEAHIEIPTNGHVSGNVIAARFNQMAEPTTAQDASPTAEDGVTDQVATDNQVPFDAILVGIVDTGRYYPIETPLDQLNSFSDKPADIVYFASEEEAKAQGFIPAD